MNFLKKGPELKLSDLKVPSFLSDLFYDLKDRHLLPLTAILLVALVAVPIALNSSDSEPAGVGAAAPSPAGQSASFRRAGQLVATSTPGLRDYRRRLRHLEATDPFQQQYPKAETSTSSESGGEAEPVEPSGSSGNIPASPGSGSGDGPTERHHIIYYSYAIDVRVTTGTSQEEASTTTASAPKVTVRRNLPELTALPSRKIPAIIYMGSSRDGGKAMMLVSSDVDAIFGDGKCLLGSQTCELISMEVGVPETFVYGGSGKSFKVELLKIGLVETDKLNKAPLGESPKHGN